MKFLHQVVVERVFKQVFAFDDVGVVEETKKHDLRRQLSDLFVLHPGIGGHLTLDDELDGDLISTPSVPSSHNKAVAARTELVFQLIIVHEVWVEAMSFGEARAVQMPEEVVARGGRCDRRDVFFFLGRLEQVVLGRQVVGDVVLRLESFGEGLIEGVDFRNGDLGGRRRQFSSCPSL